MAYKTYVFFILFLILSPLPPLPLLAEFRIATVDINQVLNSSIEAKTKRKELDEKSLNVKKQIQEKSKALKEMEGKLSEKNIPEDSKEAEHFRVQARDFSRFVKDSEEDLKKEFLKFNKSITEKALKVVAEYARTHEYDLVLDKSQKGGPVLFGDPGFDITQDISKAM